ncbi:hypothetical protein [Aquimarina algiphila]|uniref:hypothetical protein n=1 Tax=Aquimarina algiphila TaxID=2047982 RepID=UPI00232ECC9A|nr:hypothetical protein [Aquimarina algiphila]
MSNTQLIIIHSIELIAVLVGLYCTTKYREDKVSRYFVWFLLFVVIVETMGLLPRLVDGWSLFFPLKGTFFEKDNYWLYNPYLILNFVFYIFYYIKNIKSKKSKNLLKGLALFFFFSSIVNLLLTDVFFKAISAYTFILGGVLIFIGIFLYFYEVFQSDTILYFGRIFPFYVAAGTLVFHLTVTPLLIYSKYYSASSNPEFVKIYTNIITIANIFMYTCFTVGFIVCFRKNKSY